ncbi:MAG TPA: hypothetical protein VK525_11405 [Candidatus Saccharimonadales bacterium]|nr:hypothetical protein [Candidatus Saccharimonadales bacterium]
MSAEEQLRLDDQLVQYLLGTLPEEETERLDALSVSDDAFALRLLATENDLVDAYARGELAGETRNQFETFYANSSVRREKLAFAEAFRRVATARAASAAETKNVARSSGRSFFSIPKLTWQWGFAVAAFVLALATGFFAIENRNLRKQVAAGQAQRAEQWQSELAAQRAATQKAQEELDRLRASATSPEPVSVAAVLLMPQTRGSSPPLGVVVPARAENVPLALALESDEYPQYRVALTDPATGKALWTSERRTARSGAKIKMVPIELPRRLLRERNYLLELAGIRRNGSREPLSTYMFHVILE